MTLITRKIIIDALIQNETLTAEELGKASNLGFVPNKYHLTHLLRQLCISGHIRAVNDVTAPGFTITQKGIDAGNQATTSLHRILPA
jgi:hypothetical protein